MRGYSRDSSRIPVAILVEKVTHGNMNFVTVRVLSIRLVNVGSVVVAEMVEEKFHYMEWINELAPCQV